jgi:hypothetical protein
MDAVISQRVCRVGEGGGYFASKPAVWKRYSVKSIQVLAKTTIIVSFWWLDLALFNSGLILEAPTLRASQCLDVPRTHEAILR